MTQTMTREQMVAHDQAEAALYAAKAEAHRTVGYRAEQVHEAAGDKRSYRLRGRPWGMPFTAALEKTSPLARAEYQAAVQVVDRLYREITAMEDVYQAAPWPRFFPSITESRPHIHASLHCRTLHPTTRMSWAPQLSGKTEAEAVAELDEALCSVCFPSAPVALHNYVSRRSHAEQAARDAEHTARQAAKAAKTLTTGEQFRDRDDHLVATVARCKEIIREAVNAHHEALWYATPAAAERWQGDISRLAEVRANIVRRATEMATDAETAARVLMMREHEHGGWGASAEEIAKMRANAEKKARKDWEV